jgi:hypothetical protein
MENWQIFLLVVALYWMSCNNSSNSSGMCTMIDLKNTNQLLILGVVGYFLYTNSGQGSGFNLSKMEPWQLMVGGFLLYTMMNNKK